jgi:curli biogenesis system outer membrane secretion channel CsgG
MKLHLRCFTMAFAAAAITALLVQCSTSSIAINRAELKNVKTIAVMHFERAGGIPASVSQDSEESFRAHFVNAGFNVVERDRLNSIMKEVEISQTGITGNSIQLGKMLDAQAILFGDITKYESQVRLVNYNEYVKDPFTRKSVKVEKTKNMKFFTFQLHIRLVSTLTGNTILTIKNKYPERSYEMTSSTTLEKFRDGILEQMGKDLKSAIEED